MARVLPPLKVSRCRRCAMARILLVDRDRRYRSACAADLEREGHEVLAAANGLEALELLDEHTPEAVIVEPGFPGGDGIPLVYRLVETTPRPLVILNSECAYHHDAFLSWAADAELR